MTVEDLMAIYNLLGRYGHTIDDCAMGLRGWDALDDIFTREAVFDMHAIQLGALDGRDAIRDALSNGLHPHGHHFTNPIIEEHDENSVTCRIKALLVLPDGRSNTGSYTDQIVRTPEGWRIKRLTVTIRPSDTGELPPYVPTGDALAAH